MLTIVTYKKKEAAFLSTLDNLFDITNASLRSSNLITDRFKYLLVYVILAVAPRPNLFLYLGSCHVFVECFDYLNASEYVNMKMIGNVTVPPRPKAIVIIQFKRIINKR